jgi:adenylate cyclase
VYEEAIAASGTELLGRQSHENVVKITTALRNAYKASGAKGYWEKRLELAQEESKRHPMSLEIAHLYSRLGENEQAFVWLDKAYAQHDMWLATIKVEPKWDSLRSDPRFQELERRVGLLP